jgi:hypothetical protein
LDLILLLEVVVAELQLVEDLEALAVQAQVYRLAVLWALIQ